MASHYITQQLVELVKQWESFSATPYQGKGEKYLTIGYGHYGSDVKPGDVWTEAYAEKVLISQLEQFAKYTDEQITKTGWDKSVLTNNQWNALISYCYNRGPGGLNQLLRNTPKNNTSKLHDNILVYWGSNQSAKKGLLNRRKKEQALFNTPDGGEIAADGSSTPTDTTPKKTGKKEDGASSQPFESFFEAFV